jgi:hypothetical protein
VAATGNVRLATGDTVNWRNNGNGSDISLAKNTNDSLTYNNFVMPQVVAVVNSTGLSANVAQTTLYAVPANGTGMYRISAYIVETTAAGTSSTLPQVLIAWTDNDSSFANTSAPNAWTAINTGNTIGTVGNMATNTSAVLAPAGFVVNAKASTNILYSTSSYFSNPAAAMQYALHIKVEYLGN